MSADKTGNYITDHWYGRQGFAWSFWVNLVLLRVAVFLLQEWLGPAEDSDYSEHFTLVATLAVLFHVLFFVWQVVGVVRAGEAHVRTMGSMTNFWGAQLGAVVAFWLTLSYALDAWYMTQPTKVDKNFQTRADKERSEKYSMVPSSDGKILVVTGSIELGVTKKFAALLIQYPKLQTVVLTSPGGNIYEARGLSKLIRDRGMNTRVDANCSSACATAFIGGVERTLGPDAQLGFHQYRIDASYSVIATDPSAEQERDRLLYAASNVKPWFLTKMFESNSDEMWFPNPEELLEAGVVTNLVGVASTGQ